MKSIKIKDQFLHRSGRSYKEYLKEKLTLFFFSLLYILWDRRGRSNGFHNSILYQLQPQKKASGACAK
jgi:hypothetical protein